MGAWKSVRVAVATSMVAILAVGFVTSTPRTAEARLNNPIPFNEATGEPTYEFVDDDALSVYVTSDIAGGRACIVEASTADPAAGSCDVPAWGSPNVIVGIGSIITLLEAPTLLPGNWRILVEDSTGTPTAVSEVFTVTSCDTCSRELSSAVVAGWKARAGDMREGLGLTCVAFAVKDVVDQVTAARGKVKDATDRAGSYQSGDVGFVATIISVGGMGFAFPTAGGAIGAGADKALEILKDLSCAAGAMYADIVADPPDPGYDTVAEPTFASIVDTESDELDALLAAFDRQTAYGEVALTSFERYLGADIDNAEGPLAAQASAASEQTRLQVQEMRRSALALRAYAAVLDTIPGYATPLATPTEWSAIVANYDRVTQSGFNAAELQQMSDAGLDAAAVEAIRSHFRLSLHGVDPSRTLPEILRGLADTTDAAVEGFDMFAREIGAVGARLRPVGPNTAVPPRSSPSASTTSTGTPPIASSPA